MKKIPILLLVILSGKFARSQSTVKMNDLNIPTSPAFVLMDKSPASIEKPANPKALSVSLINIWQNSGAIEFAPYWFKDRAAYTFDENLKNRVPFFQTFAISAATAKADTATNISIGFRTQLFRFYSKEITDKIIAQKNKIRDSILSVENPDDIDLEAVKEDLKELNNLQAKPTFNAEIAGAYMGQTSTNVKLASTKAGFWLNLRYSPAKVVPLDFVFLTRYSWATNPTMKAGKDSAFFDYGLNLSYQNKDFDIEIEYVNRRDILVKTNYDRFTLVANYQITPGIVAVASIGKDFKEVNNVIGILGVKFGISKAFAKLQ